MATRRTIVPEGKQRVRVATGIYLKSNGKYLAQFRDPGHKQHWREFATKAEAERWRAQALLDPRTVFAGRRTLAEVWDSMLDHHGQSLRPTTVANWRQEWRKYIEPTLGTWPIGRITIPVVKSFLADLQKAGVGAATRQKVRSILHRVLEEAVENQEIAANPVAARGTRVRLPQRRRARILTTEEVRRVVAAAEVRSPSDALAIELMFAVGLRIMAQLLAEGTGATSATVWLRVGGQVRPTASWPQGRRDDTLALVGDTLPTFENQDAVEVRHQGELLGALTVTMPPADPMNPAKEKLVRDLAGQAGLVLRNVRLIEELRASRQRLVAAQDQERRRLERDLHDGAQQQLVALAVKQRLAEGLVRQDPDRAAQMLADLQAETAEALENLRDLARGIYPPLLADKGLGAALEAQARKAALSVRVETDGIGRYPQDVEAALYFCCLEAIQNVSKYANASHATVRLSDEEGLSFEVTDDGSGFDPSSTGYGSGLQGMADRLDAIGGRLEIRSRPGSGTTVTGRVSVGMAE